ncbi:xanthine dehydrogenase-like [Anticarsia gemmatalis]|uniref:xanthine dehydrogenase-like n=1 Tax=Anticarsia gemmatalis TaxID=129554 RepID=UPI003F7669B2
MDKIQFKVNGEEYRVGCEISSNETLLDYVRERLELRGTKYMCREAGCGACIVSVKRPNQQPYAVNACMIPVAACHGLEITTIEAVGNKKTGYHKLQTTLAENNGTQCGHCSPGWVMAMYSLLQTKPDRTMLDIEQSLSSNICRCTGYRPILQAFKKFAKDAPKTDDIIDIEDLSKCNISRTSCKESCSDDEDGWCVVHESDVDDRRTALKLKDGRYWYRVGQIEDVFEVLKDKGDDSYMLVAGNTAKGVYPINEYPRILIDVNGISELKGYTIDQNLIVGAGSTLTEFMNILKKVSDVEYFGYLLKLYDHLEKVAHLPVRNIGTIAGNLKIKHEHNWFASDVYLLLETVGAQVTVVRPNNVKQTVSLQEFLKLNLKGAIILHVVLPPLNDEYKLVTFKIMPRRINAHAIINAGFLFKLSKFNIVSDARVVFGGLSPSFTRAYKTERYLLGKDLFTNETLQGTLKVLDDELVVEERLPEPGVEYRRQTSLALFYKALMTLCPESKILPRYRSGAIKLHDTRPVSQARQFYKTDSSIYPVNQPIPKIDALYQCSGEAFYSEDLPSQPREVFAAFALTTVGTGEIVSIDAKNALSQPGVIAFYTAKDIPGVNTFTPNTSLFPSNEEVLCDGTVKYFNQPFGIIVADTTHIAERAAKLVKVEYKNVKKPIINTREAIKDLKRVVKYKSVTATDRGKDVYKVIKNGNTMFGQFHFPLENIVSVIHPTEEGLKVYTGSHFVDGVHIALSRALNIDQNRIDIHVRRVGGSYGLKISRNNQSAVACGLVVQKLNRPCRFIQSLTSTTKSLGKKLSSVTNFELGVNKSGVIQYMNYNFYLDYGSNFNEYIISELIIESFFNCYDKSRWNYNGFDVKTDLPKNTWFRAPGTFEAVSHAELIMEQIAYELSLDPIAVRLNNLDRDKYADIEEMYKKLRKDAEYDKRRSAVNKYNKENRWKKRGLRFSFFKWTVTPIGNFNVLVSVFKGDGTVVISHGGIEIGQGINTKAAQVCAYYLQIPIEKIQVKGMDTNIAPNSDETAGSLASQNVAVGVQKCCEILLKRLEPFKKKMVNATWEEIVKAAYLAGVDLQAQSHVSVNDITPYPYVVFGVALAEVEIDVLTGELEILRADIFEDVGKSVSPEIDVGQVQGAFIMGVGYWTSERLTYADTGELLTNRTWNLHVPLCTDIPQDFRVYFRENSYSYPAILGAKAVGEPPLCMSICVALAIREAISEARSDSGIPKSQWFPIEGPSTVDVIALSTATKKEQFKFC